MSEHHYTEPDRRFTFDLINDVFTALDKAGYSCPSADARGWAVHLLIELVRAYEDNE